MHVIFATIFHIIMAYGGLYALYVTQPSYMYTFFTYNGSNANIVYGLMAVTFAYFAIDLIWMLKKYQNTQFVYLIHHIIGLASTIIVYYYHMRFVRYYLAFLLYEISTPFLNLSYYYHKNKITNIKSILSEILFAITFVIVRVIGGTYLTYNLCVDMIIHRVNTLLYLAPIALQLLMYYWFNGIINMFKKKFM